LQSASAARHHPDAQPEIAQHLGAPKVTAARSSQLPVKKRFSVYRQMASIPEQPAQHYEQQHRACPQQA